MSEMVSIWDIAKRLKIEPTTVRRFIARINDDLGVELHRGKGDKIFLSRADADRVVAAYEARRGPISAGDESCDRFDRFGYFYLMQLVPEAIPNRIKIGFADDVEKRLGEHRTAAPTAKLLRSWPCKRSWDYAVMDCVTREACALVLNEVYEGEIDGFISRAEAFFALMPSPDAERELSEHSPLYVTIESECETRADESPTLINHTSARFDKA